MVVLKVLAKDVIAMLGTEPAILPVLQMGEQLSLSNRREPETHRCGWADVPPQGIGCHTL